MSQEEKFKLKKVIIRVPAIGRCIYCGASSYNDGEINLRNEHIIPYALHGGIVFESSSCESCERVTGRFESKFLSNYLLPVRDNFSFPSRKRKKERQEKFPIFVGDSNKKGEKVHVPSEDYPTVLFLPYFPDPPLITEIGDLGPTEYPPKPFVMWLNGSKEILKEKYGIDGWSALSIDTRILCRLLSKIAHGWCLANKGIPEFTPVLGSMIVDPNLESRDLLPYVGGFPREDPIRDEFHHIRARTWEVGGINFLVVNVRLFAFLGAPTYSIVAGVIGDSTRRNFPDCIERVRTLRNFLRVSVPKKPTKQA